MICRGHQWGRSSRGTPTYLWPVFLRRAHETKQQVDLGWIGVGFAPVDPAKQYETGKHVPDIQTARRLADVLAVPAPYLYAEVDTLAAWILAYTQASPTMRKKITRTVTGD